MGTSNIGWHRRSRLSPGPTSTAELFAMPLACWRTPDVPFTLSSPHFCSLTCSPRPSVPTGPGRMCSVIIACLKEASTEEESDVVRDVGILTPYRAQQDALRQEVRGGYNVQAVDAYQGRECEVILFSTVR